jgi:hypothetical protein
VKTTYEALVKRGLELIALQDSAEKQAKAQRLTALRSSMASALPKNVWEAIGIDPWTIEDLNYRISNRMFPAPLTAWLTANEVIVSAFYDTGNSEGSELQTKIKLTVNDLSQVDANTDRLCMMLAEVAAWTDM